MGETTASTRISAFLRISNDDNNMMTFIGLSRHYAGVLFGFLLIRTENRDQESGFERNRVLKLALAELSQVAFYARGTRECCRLPFSGRNITITEFIANELKWTAIAHSERTP